MRSGWLGATALLGLGPVAASPAGPPPSHAAASYGCWAIADQVERLACFDMALGAPPGMDAPGPGCDAPRASSCADGGKPTPPPR